MKVQVVDQALVPDEYDLIVQQLKAFVQNDAIHFILTSGGTGLGPRDVTPEATKSVIEKEWQSIMTYITSESIKITPLACLSRAVWGVANNTLIINLPGKPKAVTENLSILMISNILRHAVKSVNGECLH